MSEETQLKHVNKMECPNCSSKLTLNLSCPVLDCAPPIYAVVCTSCEWRGSYSAPLDKWLSNNK